MTIRIHSALLAFSLLPLAHAAPATEHWRLAPTGGIETEPDMLLSGAQKHFDHIEMGGRRIDAIVEWEVRPEGRPVFKRKARFPLIRWRADDTHSSFGHTFESKSEPLPLLNGAPLPAEKLKGTSIHTGLTVDTAAGPLAIRREIFPSNNDQALYERWTVTNTGDTAVTVTIPRFVQEKTYEGPEDVEGKADPKEKGGKKKPVNLWVGSIMRTEWIGTGDRILAPGESFNAGLAFTARRAALKNEPAGAPAFPDIETEYGARSALVKRLENTLVLETPDAVLNRLFAMTKVRALTAITETRGGLMQGPGGYNNFNAAVWCNDNAEYMAPYHAYLGDPAGIEAGRVTYLQFARYMNPEYKKIPSSVIAEGRGTWGGAGDRGDAAMCAQGATRYLLATGDRERAKELWPFIEWCLEYCEKRKTADGVIASNSDELEGRFSSGKTNLATSSLAYDALVSAAYLARELGLPEERARTYGKRAADLRVAIEKYFGATVEGFPTYRYHEGLENLRAWICLPVAYGITERAGGTLDAVFSDKLWTPDGLRTDEKEKTFWDRSTLFALRAGFIAGQTDRTLGYLKAYTVRRLQGDHVPYPVEAYPEAGMSHLSGESCLYARIFIEGLFGMRPTGFSSFTMTPRLPKDWPGAKLKNIRAYGREWSVATSRVGASIRVLVTDVAGRTLFDETKPDGATFDVSFPKAR